jgi:hypothetical protein
LLENEQRERQAERDAEWQRRIDALIAAHNKQLDTVERECARRVREADEQAQLAVEEREMQKAAALVRNDERIDEAHAQVERLNTVVAASERAYIFPTYSGKHATTIEITHARTEVERYQ